MGNDTGFSYVRSVDIAALQAKAEGEIFNQSLLDRDSGGKNFTVHYHGYSPGHGSHAGLHVHDFDKALFIVEGQLTFEIAGQEVQTNPGDLVFIPAGTAHRHWNSGTKENTFLRFIAPPPDPNKPTQRPAP